MDWLMIENGFLYNQSKNYKVTINSKSTKLGLSPRMWINFRDLYPFEWEAASSSSWKVLAGRLCCIHFVGQQFTAQLWKILVITWKMWIFVTINFPVFSNVGLSPKLLLLICYDNSIDSVQTGTDNVTVYRGYWH